jgi:4-carboxymuconolactone decarboxylase
VVQSLGSAGNVYGPGLHRRSSGILNLGMIAALNRPRELKPRVRGAIQGGLTGG